MSDEKFTPGPWEYVYDDNGFFYVTADDAPSPYICATGAEGDLAEANAALIAAAPQMFEALEAAREYVRDKAKYGSDFRELAEADLAKIDAALAAARGGK